MQVHWATLLHLKISKHVTRKNAQPAKIVVESLVASESFLQQHSDDKGLNQFLTS